MCRIYGNYGRCYEIGDEYQLAYDYFKKDYFLSKEVYGRKHEKTRRARKVLEDLHKFDFLYKDIIVNLREDIGDP